MAPIADGQPTGESLRYEGTYDEIKKFREEDDPNLDQGIWQTKLKKADWESIEKTCLASLKSKSKDLQVAAWLMEAWVHIYGFTGINRGLQLLFSLCDTFWEDLYPEIMEGDLELRLSPFFWINEKLSIRVALIPITQPETGDPNCYSLVDWENASRMENLVKRETGKESPDLSKLELTLDHIRANASLTPVDRLRTIYKELEESLKHLDTLGTFLDEQCQNDSPSLSRFKETLEKIQRLIVEFGGAPMDEPKAETEEHAEQQPAEGDAVAQAESKPGSGSAMAMAKAPYSGSIQNRAEAYRALSDAAEYLMRTEPHSPVPYLVKRAVSWGNLPLTELLQQLVQDPNYLNWIYDLLGMNDSETK